MTLDRGAPSGAGRGDRVSRLARVSGWADLGTTGRVLQAGVAVLALALLSMATVDVPVVRFMHRNVDGPVQTAWESITDLGDATGYVVVALLVWLAARLARRVLAPGRLRTRMDMAGRYAALMLVGLAVSGAILNIAKVAIGRLRPEYLFEAGRTGFVPFHFDFGANAFPSGHAQAIWAIVTVLCLAAPRWRIALCTLGVTVATSRVVLSTHFPSDILVGGYLGVATVLLLRPKFLEPSAHARTATGGRKRARRPAPVKGGPRQGRPTQRALGHLLIAMTAVLAVASVLFPEVDLWLMRAIHAPGSGFLLAGTALSDAYDTARGPVFKLIGLAIVGLTLAALFGRPAPGFGRGRLLALWITAVGVVGVVDNLIFKNSFGRPRPKDVSAFGGDLSFHPPWLPGGACPTNCSFPSGDVGFAFLVFGFALAAPKGRARVLAVAAATVFGLFVVFMRVLTGDHFPSDAAFGALLTLAALLTLDARLRRRGRDPRGASC